MRLYFILCVFLLGPTGCIQDGTLRSHVRPLSSAELASPHSYTALNTTGPSDEGWWCKFHDAQLNQLITVALADSPTIQQAKSRLLRAQQTVNLTSALLLPTVDASGYLQRQRFSAFGLIPPPFNGKTFNIGEIGLNFNYEFDFWGKNRQLLAADVSEACASAVELAQARLILSASVAYIYFQLQNNRIQYEIAKQRLLSQQEQLRIIEVRARHGLESDIPVSIIQAELQALKLTVFQYAQAQSLSLHQLSILMGKNPALTHIATSNRIYDGPGYPAFLPAHLLCQRPDVLASLYRMEAAAHRINAAKARFFPDINLIGLLSLQSVQLNHLFEANSQNNAITGAFDLPIFDAGARRANVGIGYAEYDMAVSDYNQTLLVALREVVDQLAILRSLRLQLQSQNKALNAAKRQYHLISLRYKQGMVEYAVVLQNKQSLLHQQAMKTALQARRLQATVNLFKALGGRC